MHRVTDAHPRSAKLLNPIIQSLRHCKRKAKVSWTSLVFDTLHYVFCGGRVYSDSLLQTVQLCPAAPFRRGIASRSEGLVAQGQRGGCQGCTGAVAALNSKDDVGHLHTGPESAEASGAKQGSRHDPLETKLYRRCTASLRGNPGNSLIRFGVPDGI